MRINKTSGINVVFSILIVFTIYLVIGFKVAGTNSNRINPIFINDASSYNETTHHFINK